MDYRAITGLSSGVQIRGEIEAPSQVSGDDVEPMRVRCRSRRSAVDHSATLSSSSPSSRDDARIRSNISIQLSYADVRSGRRVRRWLLVRPSRQRLLCSRVGVLRRQSTTSASGVQLRMLGRSFPASARRELGRRRSERIRPDETFGIFELQRCRHRPPAAHARRHTASGRRQRIELWTGRYGNHLTNC